MGETVLARRAHITVAFDGTDITKDIRPYLKSLTYTDDTDDLADDLKLALQDREGLWLEKWLTQAVEAAAGGGLRICAAITPEGWRTDTPLQTGAFELDSVDASGPPAGVTISATSLAFSGSLRQTKKSRSWENTTLSGIAGTMAGAAGLGFLFESDTNPAYDRVEQTKQSDIDFLRKLCKDAGVSIKATDGKLVLYDQAAYEKKAPVLTIRKGMGGQYTKYKLSSGSAGTKYAKCRVRYQDPATGRCIEGTAEDADESGEQCLEVTAKVSSSGEAETLARKYLRLHNKLARTAVFTLPGDTGLAAGVTVQLEGWGGWSGKYIVTQAAHSVGGNGYTTQLTMRKVLNY